MHPSLDSDPNPCLAPPLTGVLSFDLWGRVQKVGFIPVEWKSSPKVAFFCLRRQAAAGDGKVEEARLEVPEEVAELANKPAKSKTNTFQVKV